MENIKHKRLFEKLRRQSEKAKQKRRSRLTKGKEVVRESDGMRFIIKEVRDYRMIGGQKERDYVVVRKGSKSGFTFILPESSFEMGQYYPSKQRISSKERGWFKESQRHRDAAIKGQLTKRRRVLGRDSKEIRHYMPQYMKIGGYNVDIKNFRKERGIERWRGDVLFWNNKRMISGSFYTMKRTHNALNRAIKRAYNDLKK